MKTIYTTKELRDVIAPKLYISRFLLARIPAYMKHKNEEFGHAMLGAGKGSFVVKYIGNGRWHVSEIP